MDIANNVIDVVGINDQLGVDRLSQTREFLYLTDKQMLFADGVAEELFWE